MLTTQGNPPVATELPNAAPPVATAVVMTHFVVARGGPSAGKNFVPPVATGGPLLATTKWVITGKTTGITSKITEKPLE